jgi:hypothetical protein
MLRRHRGADRALPGQCFLQKLQPQDVATPSAAAAAEMCKRHGRGLHGDAVLKAEGAQHKHLSRNIGSPWR